MLTFNINCFTLLLISCQEKILKRLLTMTKFVVPATVLGRFLELEAVKLEISNGK